MNHFLSQVRRHIERGTPPIEGLCINAAAHRDRVAQLRAYVRTLQAIPREHLACTYFAAGSPEGRYTLFIDTVRADQQNPKVTKGDEIGIIAARGIVKLSPKGDDSVDEQPCAFLSNHALQRYYERVPAAKRTPAEVVRLLLRFGRLARLLYNTKFRYAKGSFRLPIGPVVAQGILMITGDPINNSGTPWIDIRTIVPTTDPLEMAQARACEEAVKAFDYRRLDATIDVPFIPRRRDGYTLQD